ncbi:MAG: hypothetical protein IPP99_00970 [Chitinophagaceae bacterium]|nr:hypothetical protein [Chitinophagaceae bacterium]
MLISSVMATSIVLLVVTLVMTLNGKRKLAQEKITLILKSDSLHIQLLESRELVTYLSKKIDSLTQKK